ncbi:MAG: CDP-6-deoxy-delta-3,4-glucoseen reductase [Gammaproteobacteria bacterium RIFCSPHIGHO2_12_FULL_63_22]|nr:MAG: CDP-6-deoxy-delta-3,4-glucoseen reductase [Gammaproteobacteria bacterium RIFCSPHIGHO2_12_FULL_63_22]
MAAVQALDSLLRDPRLWRGQDNPPLPPSRHATGFTALDDALPAGGWPEASLVEILFSADGLGELSLLLPTLAALSSDDRPVLVVAPPYRVYAPAWQAAGLQLSQLHVLDANPKDALWAMEQALRAGCCGAVLGWPMQADDNSLRRLQVAAETGQTPGFAFRPMGALSNPSPAALRLSLRGTDSHPELRILKCRGALPPSRPIPFHPYPRH